MYKTSISMRMLFMTLVILLGLMVFSVIIVSRSLDVYSQNRILRERLVQKEALVKQFTERSEAFNQYRLLEKELKKLVDQSSLPVVYARSNGTLPEATTPPATSPGQYQTSAALPENSASEQVETSQWDQEPDVPMDSSEDSQGTPPVNESNSEEAPDSVAKDASPATDVPQSKPEQPPTTASSENEPTPAVEKKGKTRGIQTAENKPATKPETNTVPETTGPVVDVDNLNLTVENNNTVNFQYTLSNIHPNHQTVAGYIFIILANPYINPPLFAPFPAVPLVGGFPADYRKGTQFSIKRGKTVRGKLPGLIDPGHYNQAWIFAYSKDGELILKKHLISNNG